MRISGLVCVAAFVASCGGGSGTPGDAGYRDAPTVDAPGVGPMITSFVATPSQVPSGVPTMVTWNWTYAIDPTYPDPTCSINNGVGAVTRGQATTVTLTAVTTFTLTCSNFAGTASRNVVVSVPPVAPIIGTFTATPSVVPSDTPTSVTWTWTYTNSPTPTPVCTIEFGVGTVTSGATTSVTQTGSRTYRLRCTNSQGTTFANVTINVNECLAGTAQCNANATCTDTLDSYTCTCNSGYTGNGDTCSALVSCPGTPCSANATCVGNASCVCNIGFVGDGLTCQRMLLAFTTSTTGTGNLSTWSDAGGNTGLAAADAICNARAAAGSLPGTYRAWMSDSTSDAYCRIHNLTGKKINNCGLGSLPVAAGPWARPDGKPFAPTIDRLLAPTRATYYPANRTEANVEVAVATDRVYTGTDDTGVLNTTACTDWTSTAVTGAMGELNGGGSSWTDIGVNDPSCASTGHLRCFQVGTGPALPPRHPVAKKAFLTSVYGSGNFAVWPDAGGLTGLSAADAICQARARYGGYANSQNFKAWISTGTYATNRVFSTAYAWARPDGVVIGDSKTDAFLDGRLAAPLYMTEDNSYAAGNVETGLAWTGTTTAGVATFYYCSTWGFTSSTGTFGRHDLSDGRWINMTTSICSVDGRLYCVED